MNAHANPVNFNRPIYTKTARFDAQERALTEDEMRAVAPSIFAVTAHESRSQRFRPIPTIDILRGLAKEGFHAVGVVQGGSRTEDRREFTKHMVRLRRLDEGRKYQVNDTVAEILLKNANDGTSAYDLMSGLFRVRCLNSLVTQTATFDTLKVRHSGDAVREVIEGTYRVLGQTEAALTAPQEWEKIVLAQPMRQALAEAAHVLRFADAEGMVNTPIQADQLLRARRMDDRANDLWTTFNVVQENVLRGGLTGRKEGVQRGIRGRRVTTRDVNGIDQSVKLNQALWVLGERMASALKSAA